MTGTIQAKITRATYHWEYVLLLLLSMFMDIIFALNEDGDTLQLKQSKFYIHAERGLRLTEGLHGVPVPIDNLFDQISALPSDDQGQNVDSECLSGSELSEMDVCLTPDQAGMFDSLSLTGPTGKRRRRQASANGFSLWTDGVIPYVFNSTFPAQDRDAILSAMSEWETTTCVRFRPANRLDTDFVVFRDGRRCSTNIGRIGGEQVVTLAKTCRSKRILIHELGHVIGLIHEHQRHDRDKYVKVLLENVRNMSQERYQFSKLLSGSITDKAVKYDYTSIMHYGRNYFAKSPELTTLQTTERLYQDVIGRAEKPSFGDTETVNQLYKCSAACPPVLQCDESCFMDNACSCRCPTGIDKVYLSGADPNRNSLLDSTCEFFASRGECSGSLKDALRPLCAKTCGLYDSSYSTLPVEAWTQAPISSTNHLQSKPASSPWGTNPGTQGNTGRSSQFYNNEVNDAGIRRNTGNLLRVLATQHDPLQPHQPQPQRHQLHNQQLLPLSDTHQPPGLEVIAQQLKEEIMNAPLTNNLRAAIQQGHVTRSSALQSLILSSSSSDKTPGLFIPTDRNARILRQPSTHVVHSDVHSFLRQDTTKTPSVVLKHLLNIDSPFNHLSRWLNLSHVARQHHRQQQQHGVSQKDDGIHRYQTVRPRMAPSSERQTPQDEYNIMHARVATGLSIGDSANWQVDASHTNRHSGPMNLQILEPRTQTVPDRPHIGGQNTMLPSGDVVLTVQLQKTVEPNIMGPTTGVDRINEAMTSADFTGPETGQFGLGSTSTNITVMGPDSGQSLQTTGPSFMKSVALPQSLVISEQNNPMGNPVEQVSNEPWSLQVQELAPMTEVQPQVQYYQPQQPQPNLDPVTGQNSQQVQQQQQLSTWGGPLGSHRASVAGMEPYVETVNFENYREPVNHHRLESVQLPQAVPNHQLSVSGSSDRNIAPQQQQLSPFFSMLNAHHSLTDPVANSLSSQPWNTSAPDYHMRASENVTSVGQNPVFVSASSLVDSFGHCCPGTGTNAVTAHGNKTTKTFNSHRAVVNGIFKTGRSSVADFSTLVSSISQGSRFLNTIFGEPVNFHPVPSVFRHHKFNHSDIAQSRTRQSLTKDSHKDIVPISTTEVPKHTGSYQRVVTDLQEKDPFISGAISQHHELHPPTNSRIADTSSGSPPDTTFSQNQQL